jgi:hypothetical protein
LATAEFVYGADIFALLCSFVASAYIIVKTVDAAVKEDHGFYEAYADWSVHGNYLFLWELIVIAAFEIFALAITIVSLFGADDLWRKTEERMAEAAEDSIGLENALTWSKAIKMATLCLLWALATLVSGYSLGETAAFLINWFNEYDDDTDTEHLNPDDGLYDEAGTAAKYDIYIHLVVSIFGWAVLSAIAMGSWVFDFTFLTYEDDVECDFGDLDPSVYDGFTALVS